MSSFFDQETPRYGTDSLKYDCAVQRKKPAHILPMWVADMDFPAPPAVLDAMKCRVEHGIFGYSVPGNNSYFCAVADWFTRRHCWTPREEWLVKTPGVVFAISAAIRAFTSPGDAVLIQQPVYYPFRRMIEQNHRRLVDNPLVLESGRYHMDLADFERKIVEEQVKLFILCSPHNPVGRVWTKEELCSLAEVCLRHHVLVVSDEIHCDFVWGGHKHTVFASLSEEAAQNCVVCTAPSKTFNLAGLQISNIFIPNPSLRHAFEAAISSTGYDEINTMGLIACKAAYTGGENWLEELKSYLSENIAYTHSYLAEHLPAAQLTEPEGTYLLWVDCSALEPDPKLREAHFDQAGLWLDSGVIFGPTGSGFERLNIACPRSTLSNGLERFVRAFSL